MFQLEDHNPETDGSNSLHNHATELNCLLQLDSSSFEHLQLPVFNENAEAITEQPRQNDVFNNSSSEDVRRPIPVSVIDLETRNETQFIATSGLDFLIGIPQLFVQQTIELHDMQNSRASAKRYLIKRSDGHTMYYAVEQSTSFQRMCFGSRRRFEMILQDRTQQVAIIYRRRLACCTSMVWCCLQVLEVWTPDGQVGFVQQEMSFGLPILTVRNISNTIIYRIEGPPICACKYTKEAYFKIYSADGMTQCGSINHSWNAVQVEYTLLVHFPSPSTDKTLKALILGAAFLLEYMYFETSRSGACLCIC